MGEENMTGKPARSSSEADSGLIELHQKMQDFLAMPEEARAGIAAMMYLKKLEGIAATQYQTMSLKALLAAVSVDLDSIEARAEKAEKEYTEKKDIKINTKQDRRYRDLLGLTQEIKGDVRNLLEALRRYAIPWGLSESQIKESFTVPYRLPDTPPIVEGFLMNVAKIVDEGPQTEARIAKDVLTLASAYQAYVKEALEKIASASEREMANRILELTAENNKNQVLRSASEQIAERQTRRSQEIEAKWRRDKTANQEVRNSLELRVADLSGELEAAKQIIKTCKKERESEKDLWKRLVDTLKKSKTTADLALAVSTTLDYFDKKQSEFDAKYEDLLKNYAVTSHRIETQEAQIEQIRKTAEDTIKSLKEEVSAKAALVQSVQAACDEAQATYESLRTDYEKEKGILTESVKSLYAEIAERDAVIDEFKKKFAALEDSQNDLENKFSTSESAAQGLKTQLDAFKEENRNLVEKVIPAVKEDAEADVRKGVRKGRRGMFYAAASLAAAAYLLFAGSPYHQAQAPNPAEIVQPEKVAYSTLDKTVTVDFGKDKYVLDFPKLVELNEQLRSAKSPAERKKIYEKATNVKLIK